MQEKNEDLKQKSTVLEILETKKDISSILEYDKDSSDGTYSRLGDDSNRFEYDQDSI